MKKKNYNNFLNQYTINSYLVESQEDRKKFERFIKIEKKKILKIRNT